MAEMEEKIRNLEASTYDGVFIWKITEFARKRQEAITGRSPAIFSPGCCPRHCRNLLRLSGVWDHGGVLSRGGAARADVLLFRPPLLVDRWVFSIGLSEPALEELLLDFSFLLVKTQLP